MNILINVIIVFTVISMAIGLHVIIKRQKEHKESSMNRESKFMQATIDSIKQSTPKESVTSNDSSNTINNEDKKID
ncbi:hypothetical protein EUA76_01795 [TM7 phylum sp. oral taxon 350]|nr:hypothetical protein EUA76_01795 [TM7 phylum sp. oral taxon 350]